MYLDKILHFLSISKECCKLIDHLSRQYLARLWLDFVNISPKENNQIWRLIVSTFIILDKKLVSLKISTNPSSFWSTDSKTVPQINQRVRENKSCFLIGFSLLKCWKSVNEKPRFIFPLTLWFIWAYFWNQWTNCSLDQLKFWTILTFYSCGPRGQPWII